MKTLKLFSDKERDYHAYQASVARMERSEIRETIS